MPRYRFSIRSLMVVILLLALAFTALRTPSRIWANAWYTLALGGVTIAIPAAVANLGQRRAFWIGFAVCGGVYFVFSLAPWLDKEVGHQLFTTTILDLASESIVDNHYMLRNYLLAINPPSGGVAPTAWQVWNLPDFQLYGQWSIGYVKLHSSFLFLRIGHSVFCLLFGLAGGEVARFLWLTRAAADSSRVVRQATERPRVEPVPFITPDERAAAPVSSRELPASGR